MQFLILAIILTIILILLAIVSEFNIKRIKKLADNNVLQEMVKKFPSNMQICQYLLDKLGNNHTKIKENKDATTSLYVVATDTILIANIENIFTRVQTVAHECLHSVQSKKMLWFNFIYSNIFIIFYILIVLLTILGVIKDGMLFCSIFLAMTILFYFVRSYLEIDAMIKARFLAKEYIMENKLTSKGNVEIIMKEYDKINNIGIKATCFLLLNKQIIKLIIYCIICFVIEI